MSEALRGKSAHELRAEGLSLRQIAAELGWSVRRVRKTFDPERVARADREQNAKRNAAKRAWENRADNRPACDICGGPCSLKNRNGVCARCLVAGQRWAHELVLDMRRAGRLNHEIADVLGYHPQRIENLLAAAGEPSGYDDLRTTPAPLR